MFLNIKTSGQQNIIKHYLQISVKKRIKNNLKTVYYVNKMHFEKCSSKRFKNFFFNQCFAHYFHFITFR